MIQVLEESGQEFSVAFTIDLSNEFPPPFVVSSLYRGSCFALNNGLRSNIPSDEDFGSTSKSTWDETHSDPIQVPIGPVTRARAKEFKDALIGLIQATSPLTLTFLFLGVNYSNLSGFSVAFTNDLSINSSIVDCGVVTIPRFLPLIGNGSRLLPFEPVCRNDLRDLLEYGFRHIVGVVRIIWYQSFDSSLRSKTPRGGDDMGDEAFVKRRVGTVS
ncbi:hypothetical protein TIFTF001_030247 [Ficus carica]|uniref:Uncharacterized protein n=1 Tax=Ficus carica TaxID=3494 RepID=A0AA88DSW5_FICCA|nr:hypothetical protein TIFTF001_030247 [Ficus carica]